MVAAEQNTTQSLPSVFNAFRSWSDTVDLLNLSKFSIARCALPRPLVLPVSKSATALPLLVIVRIMCFFISLNQFFGGFR